MSFQDVFATQLKKTLAEKGMQQSDLAKKTGFSSQTVSNYCTGKNFPGAEALVLISQTLNVSIDDLLCTGVENKGTVSRWKALQYLVTAADSLKLDVSKDGGCYVLSFDPDRGDPVAGESLVDGEYNGYMMGSFFESWMKYRELLKAGHLTQDEYDSLIERRVTNAR